MAVPFQPLCQVCQLPLSSFSPEWHQHLPPQQRWQTSVDSAKSAFGVDAESLQGVASAAAVNGAVPGWLLVLLVAAVALVGLLGLAMVRLLEQ